MTNLSSSLGDSLTSSPIDDIEVDEGVEREEDIGRGDHEEEHAAVDDVREFARMHTRCCEEDQHHRHYEHRRRGDHRWNGRGIYGGRR